MPSYQSRTLAQIRQELQRRIRSTDTATGTHDIITGIDRSINQSIHEITSFAFWDWTIREFWFNTVPVVNSFTTQAVSIAAASSHITGSGTVFTAGMVGSFILVAGGKVPYEISTISVAQDTASLVVGYEGSTNVTAGSFKILRDSFTVDERVRAIRKVTLESGSMRRTLRYVPPRTWDDRIPLSVNESDPQFYTIIRWTSDGVPRMRVWPVPNTRHVVRFTAYCWLPELTSDSAVCEIPGPAHRVLEDLSYARIVENVIHLPSNEVAQAREQAFNGLTALLRDNNTRPDWDTVVGDYPFGIDFGRTQPLLPPEFGPILYP